jgi:uncharacterized protein (DUF1330 family)
MAYRIASRQPIRVGGSMEAARLPVMPPEAANPWAWLAAESKGWRPRSCLEAGKFAELGPDKSSLRRRKMGKKGYWIAHVNITDPERYQDYIAANAIAFRKYNARFLVRAGAATVVKGDLAGHRHVVIEFENYARAKACHDSPEYQAAAKIRDEASDGHLIIIEGDEG